MAKTKTTTTPVAEKVRYSDEELQEFKALILEKLDAAKKEYEVLKGSVDLSLSLIHI